MSKPALGFLQLQPCSSECGHTIMSLTPSEISLGAFELTLVLPSNLVKDLADLSQ